MISSSISSGFRVYIQNDVCARRQCIQTIIFTVVLVCTFSKYRAINTVILFKIWITVKMAISQIVFNFCPRLTVLIYYVENYIED